jgi:hypothetical protein
MKRTFNTSSAQRRNRKEPDAVINKATLNKFEKEAGRLPIIENERFGIRILIQAPKYYPVL